MAARDDSVIRGSLITCLIFLVLSLAVNFFLWQMGNTSAQEADRAKQSEQTAQQQVREMEASILRFKSMLGSESVTVAEVEELRRSSSEDPVMQTLEEQFERDTALLGPSFEPQNRNYKTLVEHLVRSLRTKNEDLRMQKESSNRESNEAKTSVANAKNQQQMAEQVRDQANQRADDLASKFDEERSRMNRENEDTKDKLSRQIQEYQSLDAKGRAERTRLNRENRTKQATIDSQKNELNRLRGDRFETAQGEIRFVSRGKAIINLGSANELRRGVTFSVFDADETRPEEAVVKARIEVDRIEGPYTASARVIDQAEIRNPIIAGDKIYSPFWAPGREVKIALAGDIDIDGDGRPDNEALKGQIRASGAKVAAEVSSTGAGIDQLDSSIRFLVLGEDPEITMTEDDLQLQTERDKLEAMGLIKAKAAELGLTVIPVTKLQDYLATISRRMVPLGSATSGDDFPPPPRLERHGTRIPGTGADLYKPRNRHLLQ